MAAGGAEAGEDVPGAPFAERDLRGAVVLVTGVSRGIGASLCRELLKRGCRVVGLSRTAPAPEPALEGLHHVSCDVGDRTSLAAALEQVKERYGHVDVVVANAAIMPGIFMDPLSVSDELEEEELALNVGGVHFLVKYSLPLLLASPNPLRTVVYVSSSASFCTEPEEGNGMLLYRASKAAANGHMVALHQLYCTSSETAVRTRGGADKTLCRVVAVHPGFVATGLGLETAPDFKGDGAAYSAAKATWGAVSLEAGTDSILWAIAAKDGVEGGKLYYLRKPHTF